MTWQTGNDLTNDLTDRKGADSQEMTLKNGLVIDYLRLITLVLTRFLTGGLISLLDYKLRLSTSATRHALLPHTT